MREPFRPGRHFTLCPVAEASFPRCPFQRWAHEQSFEAPFPCVSRNGAFLSGDTPMTALTLLDDPAHWQQRADEMHRMAKDMNGPAAKGAMLNIAAEYQLLVERARERRAAEKSSWSREFEQVVLSCCGDGTVRSCESLNLQHPWEAEEVLESSGQGRLSPDSEKPGLSFAGALTISSSST